jgi:cyanophycin synthetase
MGEIVGGSFDRVVLYRDEGNRDREDGELLTLLLRGLGHGTRLREKVETVGERQAIEAALGNLTAGELVVIGVEAIDEALELVRRLLHLPPGGRGA